MLSTPEIICNVFSFLDKDQIERVQFVNQFWNSVIIRHKNILPLRQFARLTFTQQTSGHWLNLNTIEIKDSDYKIKFVKTKISQIKKYVSSRYSQLTVDEVLTNLNDVVFDHIQILLNSKSVRLDDLLNMMKLVTTKTGGRFCGRYGICNMRFSSHLNEIFDNYIIVGELLMGYEHNDSYIREVCANPEIVQLPSTPKEIRHELLKFKENEELLNFTCNGKLDGANRVTIEFTTSEINYGNFIRQWFELYRTHQNPISLVGKFERNRTYEGPYDGLVFVSVLGAVKTFLNNTQLRVKYSLETKEFHRTCYEFFNHYLKRSCVLHETDSYALLIEMEYGEVYMSSINASDLDQPPCNKMETISFCIAADVYSYFLDISLMLNTICLPIMIYVIVTQSSNMGPYKWYLLVSIIWDYSLDFFLSLMQPVFLFPFYMAYVKGLAQHFVNQQGCLIFMLLVFVIFINICVNQAFSFLYRLAHISPFFGAVEFFETPRKVIPAIIFFQCLLYLFFVTPVAFLRAIPIEAWTEAVETEAPALEPFLTHYPGVFGSPYYYAITVVTRLIFGMTIASCIFFILWCYVFYYRLKKWAPSVSASTYRIQKMLFAALVCQTMNLIIFLFIPLAIASIVMSNRYKYSSYVALSGICIVSMHGLADIVAVIYFIKSYREFFGRVFGKISKLYASPNVSSAEPMINNVIASQPQRIQPAVSSVQIYSQIHRNLRRNLQ